MLLKVEGLSCNNVYAEFERPKHLVPLGDSLWPEGIKNTVNRIFKKIGVEDPMRQKLVEPFARVFGGRERDGISDLEDVNWDKVVDYFRWEASAWTRLRSKENELAHDKLIDEIWERWGGCFSHQMVYSDGKSW